MMKRGAKAVENLARRVDTEKGLCNTGDQVKMETKEKW